jgi:hypothetical protein
MNRSTVSFLVLVASLVCFVVAFLLSTATLHGGNYHPWVDGGFIALVTSLLIDRAPQG